MTQAPKQAQQDNSSDTMSSSSSENQTAEQLSDNPSKEAAQEATIIRGGSQLLANYIKIDYVSKPYNEVLLLAQKYLQLDFYLCVSG